MKKAIIVIISFVALLIIVFTLILVRDRQTRNDDIPDSADTFTETIPVSNGFNLWTEPIDDENISTEGNPFDYVDIPSIGNQIEDEAGSVEVVAAEEEKGYSIVFYDMDDSVFIVLTGSPFRETRIRAEKMLLEKLGITKSAACQINVRLSVFANYDMTNYGLSFCPDGKPLPQE